MSYFTICFQSTQGQPIFFLPSGVNNEIAALVNTKLLIITYYFLTV